MQIAPNFAQTGARLRANGAGEVAIQIAPANTDLNALAACANGANTIESAFRGSAWSTLYRPAHSGASGPGRANQSKLASARRIRLAPMTFGSGSSLKDG